MSPARPAQEPFFFHHGRLALSFMGTVGNRGSDPVERVPTPERLGDWCRAAQLVESRGVPTAATYRRALELREAIARVVGAVVADRRPPKADVAQINAIAHRWGPRLALDARTLGIVQDARDPFQAALGRIAYDAIEFLANAEERSRLRTCANDDCGSVFLTPAGRRERRWCSMARCGNRAKVTAFRKRAEG